MSATAILIVDDDPDIREFFHIALSHEGYEVRVAEGGAQALALIRERKPDALILDLMMPEMTGDEVCEAVKQDPELRDMIVFILSARGDVQTKLRCFEKGADEYLVKPVDPQEITARIERSLKFRRSGSGARKVAGPTQAPRDGSASTRKYGPYEVEGLVGSGGMGQVFKGLDALLERPVAIKVLSRQLTSSGEFVQRFRREARLLASINHPGIATIYSFGTEGTELYFSMQWCAGGSLAELIYRDKRISPTDAADYVLQCAQALAAASRKGIVHRDIKPSNLMFDEDGRIKIVDFGIAYSGQSSVHLTDASEILGTPLYMSPEQARGQTLDHRADIYSLGIVFFYMLYGKPPFTGDGPMDIILSHATKPLPEYRDLDIPVPYRVYAVIERMTRKDSGARYQDYESLIDDLNLIRAALALPKADDSTLTEIPLRDLIEQVGGYVLEAEVGRDMSGRTCKGYHPDLQRYAAVTLLSPEWCTLPGLLDELPHRIQVLKNLNHPGIGTLFDFGREGDTHYLAQEWFPGGSVTQLVRMKGRLDPSSALSLILQMARVLSTAAAAGILHGSLKPNNILLDEHQNIKIMDFPQSSPLLAVSSQDPTGNDRFHPPAGAGNFPLAGDIYTLGIILYYMLYGITPRVPGPGEDSLPPFEDLGGVVPLELYETARRMTSLNPETRYSDYESLIQGLEQLQLTIDSQRGLGFPSVRDIAPAAVVSGRFLDVLSQAYARGYTGVLVVRWSVLETRLIVRHREVVLFQSNQPAKDIWRFMAKEHSIRKEDIPENLDLAGGLQSLLEKHACGARDFIDSYRRLMTQAIEEVFIWPVSEAQFLEATVEQRAFTTIRISDVLLEAARRIVDLAQIRQDLAPSAKIEKTAGFEHLLSSFHLTPAEIFLAYRIEGRDTTVESLCLLTGFPEEQVLRLVFLLHQIGAIRLV